MSSGSKVKKEEFSIEKAGIGARGLISDKVHEFSSGAPPNWVEIGTDEAAVSAAYKSFLKAVNTKTNPVDKNILTSYLQLIPSILAHFIMTEGGGSFKTAAKVTRSWEKLDALLDALDDVAMQPAITHLKKAPTTFYSAISGVIEGTEKNVIRNKKSVKGGHPILKTMYADLAFGQKILDLQDKATRMVQSKLGGQVKTVPWIVPVVRGWDNASVLEAIGEVDYDALWCNWLLTHFMFKQGGKTGKLSVRSASKVEDNEGISDACMAEIKKIFDGPMAGRGEAFTKLARKEAAQVFDNKDLDPERSGEVEEEEEEEEDPEGDK